MIQLAGKLASRFLAGGGKELLGHAAPGAITTGILSTLSTGNPVAGLAVAGADLIGSTALARGLGKISPKLAGRYETIIPEGGKAYKQYTPSLAQNIGMGVGSIGSIMAIEPIFAGQQLGQLNQQQIQQLTAEPLNMDQTATTQQQLIQRQLIDQVKNQALSPGTMFQMQGVESTLLRPSAGIDQYGLARGAL